MQEVQVKMSKLCITWTYIFSDNNCRGVTILYTMDLIVVKC